MGAPGEEIWPVISNLFFLLPAWGAFCLGRYTRFMVYLFIVVASSMYHACLGFGSACHLSPTFYRAVDFFFAQLVIPLTALYVIRFPPRYYWIERVIILAFAFVIVFIQTTLGDSLYIQMILSAVSLILIVVYWIAYNVYRIHNPQLYKGAFVWEIVPDIYIWDHFVLGIGLTLVASSLFSTQLQMPRYYWAIHSCWHATAAMGQYFVLFIHKAPPNTRYAPLDYAIRGGNIAHIVPPSRVMF
jgi:hypothetical protein